MYDLYSQRLLWTSAWKTGNPHSKVSLCLYVYHCPTVTFENLDVGSKYFLEISGNISKNLDVITSIIYPSCKSGKIPTNGL